MTGSTFKRCPHGTGCPDLGKRRHGSWFYAVRITTTAGRQLVRRGGFALERDAEAALRQVHELVASDPDPVMRAKIGDLIMASTKRGGPLPDAATVRRKIGAGLDPASPDITTGDWLTSWLTGKGKLKASVRRSYAQHIACYLAPVIKNEDGRDCYGMLGEIPLARLRAEHIAGVFATIREWNAEIERQRAAGKALIVLDGDVRKAPQVVGDATMHRIYATLRAALNAAVKARLIAWNPCAGVELPSERREEARVWGPDEAALFLDATAEHRLHAAWRLVLVLGLRRGELGLQWDDIDTDSDPAYLRIRRTLLEAGGRVWQDTPKSKTSARVVPLDGETVRLLREHRKAQLAERLAAGSAYEPGPGGGWVICDEIGRPYRPDLISARFRQAARAAGLPVIKLHEGRHTAAVLHLEAGNDLKVVSAMLGHSTTAITSDIYQHVRQAVAADAAERVAALLAPRRATQ